VRGAYNPEVDEHHLNIIEDRERENYTYVGKKA
jgi:hypothetical protein